MRQKTMSGGRNPDSRAADDASVGPRRGELRKQIARKNFHRHGAHKIRLRREATSHTTRRASAFCRRRVKLGAVQPCRSWSGSYRPGSRRVDGEEERRKCSTSAEVHTYEAEQRRQASRLRGGVAGQEGGG